MPQISTKKVDGKLEVENKGLHKREMGESMIRAPKTWSTSFSLLNTDLYAKFEYLLTLIYLTKMDLLDFVTNNYQKKLQMIVHWDGDTCKKNEILDKFELRLSKMVWWVRINVKIVVGLTLKWCILTCFRNEPTIFLNPWWVSKLLLLDSKSPSSAATWFFIKCDL